MRARAIDLLRYNSKLTELDTTRDDFEAYVDDYSPLDVEVYQQAMSREQRQLTDYILSGYKPDEIAQKMNCSKRTIYRRFEKMKKL